MSANQTPFPGAVDTAPANGRHAGLMPRWHVGDATHAPFGAVLVGGHSDVYGKLATASVAGAMTPAQFTKLAGLQVPLARLNYNANASDVMNGVALTANIWTDVHANQSFTITSLTSLFLVELRLSVNFANPATDTSVGARLNFDSAGTPVLAEADGGIGKASEYGHTGGHFFLAQNFAAGTHTVKAQVIASTAATAYCRANTAPNFEWAKIIIFEVTP